MRYKFRVIATHPRIIGEAKFNRFYEGKDKEEVNEKALVFINELKEAGYTIKYRFMKRVSDGRV